MGLLKLIFKKEKIIEIPKIENVRLEHLGTIWHGPPINSRYERIIAGERIPDIEEKLIIKIMKKMIYII